MYSINDLAVAAGVSRRSIYNYAERRLIPPPLRQSGRLVYTDDHLRALQVVRVLGRMGVPVWQIERLLTDREPGEVRRILGPVGPLAARLEEAEELVSDLRLKLNAPPDDLDLRELGLEDPVRLRRELGQAERVVRKLTDELRVAGAQLLRELTHDESEGSMTRASVADADTGPSITRLNESMERIIAQLDELTRESAGRAFRDGLMAAWASGWRPVSAEIPAGLSPEEHSEFRKFVAHAGTPSHPAEARE